MFRCATGCWVRPTSVKMLAGSHRCFVSSGRSSSGRSKFEIPPNPHLTRPVSRSAGASADDGGLSERVSVSGQGRSSKQVPFGKRAAAGRALSGADYDSTGFSTYHHAETAATRSAQSAYERASSSRAMRDPRAGHIKFSTERNLDIRSGEAYRAEQQELRADARAGASDADEYRSAPGPSVAPRTKRHQHIDPDDIVDNFIPVARATNDYYASSSATSAEDSARNILRDRTLHHVDVAGSEDIIDPGTRTDATVFYDDEADPSETVTAVSDKSVTVSEKSALYRSLINPLPLKSRRGKNTWNTLRQPSEAVEREVEERSTEDELIRSQGHFTARFERTNLEHFREAVQYSVSIYTKQPLVVEGLTGYHNFLTRREEKDIMAELVKLLKTPGAASFQAEEGRYCVNLFEKRLGVHTRDTPLTFAIKEDAPTLHECLVRAVELRLIPAMPNTVQVSEYVSPFGGYKPHLKHPSIGQYMGLLSLVGDNLMVLQHIDQNWTPQIDGVARSLYIVTAPALFEYRVGYPNLDADVRTHKHRSRMTKDYRIEVLFATTDSARVPALGPSVRLTEESERRGLPELAAKLAATRAPTDAE
jgi:hypothetical protein